MAQEMGAPVHPAATPKASLATIVRLEKLVERESAARLAAEERAEREGTARLAAEERAEHAHRTLNEKQEALRRYIAYVELLQDITVAANQAKTIDDAYAYALRQICIRDGWPVGHVYVVASDGSGELAPTGIWYLDEPTRFEAFRQSTAATRFARGAGLPGRVLAEEQPIWIVDVTQAVDSLEARFDAELGIRTAFALPIWGSSDVLAVLELYSTEARECDAQLLDVAEQIGTQLGHVVERARSESALRRAYDDLWKSNNELTREIGERTRAEAELSHLAFYDTLTDLPNRALFLDRLDHALSRADRRHSVVGVLFLDLDNFKVVNDSLGHDVGDLLLKTVSERLRTTLRVGDTVARFGGDEFTILLEDLNGLGDAVCAAERIVDVIREPVLLEGTEVVPSFSIGIVLGTPGNDCPDDLLRNADLAMYRAKVNGKARFEVFDQSMNAEAMARLEVEADLRRALERNELRLHYQPIVSLESGRIRAVEALARWQHPQRGLVSPLQFIPIAEETGLIVPLGRWVLEEACRQIKHWQITHPEASELLVSVNLSGRQFQNGRLVEEVQEILRETGLDPACLQLEITETAVMKDAASTIKTLHQLKALGVKLAIDDFGTGYSSLSYLRQFPVDTLKIDRSFIDGLGREAQDTELVRSVIAMAKSLSLAVTSEGIETTEQLTQLLELGCDRGQGFYFARPLPPEAFGEALWQDCRTLIDETGPNTPTASDAA
jgi:diguanylate cyclase (GGDEF)-like protein